MRQAVMVMLLIVCPILTARGAGALIREPFPSRLLGRQVHLGIHVPSAESIARWRAAHPKARLRLVLFLPGAYDGPEDLEGSGLDEDLRRREAEGLAAPSLWIAVEHFKSWYADRKDGTFPYERFLMDELIPAVEQRFPAFGGAPAARTIAGLSMGGFGALNLASRTGAFGRCVALSPALIEPPFDRVSFFLRRSLRRAFPEDPEAFAPWNPWRHYGGTAELILGCGTEDKYGLAAATQAFAARCAAHGRACELRLAPGGHDWTYWRKAFAELAPRIAQPDVERSDIVTASARPMQ